MGFVAGESALPDNALSACNVAGARYRYIEDLLALNQCRPDVCTGSMTISATVNVATWKEQLLSHADARFTDWVFCGFDHCLRIGFDYSRHQCRAAKRNMKSAKEQKTICSYLRKERARRRMIDPPPAAKNTQISPFGVITKPHQPGKWRLILDLSSPRGSSVNDGIDPQLCSLSYARSYARLDDKVKRVLSHGSGALLTKIDIQSAYRIIPVHPADHSLLAHPADHSLLGMKWQGTVSLDDALPFGLRSTPKIFSAVADALLGTMYKNGVMSGIHYLS